MPKTNYVYFDANVFLAYFNAEPNRIRLLDQLIDEIQKDNNRKIITSVLSITEVSHVAEEKLKHRLNQRVYDAIESFWGDSSLIEFVEINELIARQSRDLVRKAISLQYALRPLDALHLVSAQFAGVTECFTYDDKLPKFSSTLGIDIREPYVNSPRLPLNFDDKPDNPQ